MEDELHLEVNARLDAVDEYIRNSQDIKSDCSEKIISSAESHDLMRHAYKEAYVAFYKSLFTRQFKQDFVTEGKLPMEPKWDDARELVDRARNAVISKPPYAFITINPYSHITLDELRKYVDKFKKRKILDSYHYVYEVRKEDLSGLHCHMLVKYNCKPYELKRNIKNTFKHVCDESNPHILNIKFIEKDIIESKIRYMEGDKKDAKQEGVKATKEYRHLNALSDHYSSVSPISCRDTE